MGVAQDYAPSLQRFGVDERLRLIVLHPGPQFHHHLPVTSLDLGGQQFLLSEPITSLRYDRSYPAARRGVNYQVHFTRLPLFTLTTEEDIRDDPKVPVTIHYADATRTLTRTGGVEYRGNFALTLPKKTFDLEFSEEVSFGNLRSDDDWILDALYNEPLRVNAFVSHRLWLDQHRLYYAGRDARATAGPGVSFAEAFVNGSYYGVQMLSEQVDRKQLRLKKRDGARVRGELYKGSDHLPGTDFTSGQERPDHQSENWSGWEWKYPNEGGIDWNNLLDFHRFVTESSDEEFATGIAGRVRLDNVVDNLLFVNLLGMIDNSHRNVYLARYDDTEPYFFIPWDFDGSWGNSPRGVFIEKAGFWHANGLTRRLTKLNPDGFNERLCERYRELRANGLYHPDSLIQRLHTAIATLRADNVYARERLAWPRGPVGTELLITRSEEWIRSRVRFMDDYVCSLSLRPSAYRPEEAFIVYPNPASGFIVIEQQSGFVEPVFTVRDALGRMMVRSLSSIRFVIDIGDWPPGMYYVQLGEQLQTFIVQGD